MIRIDYTQLALCAAVIVSCIALLSQWRAFRRMRDVVQRDLARIFEQVDLIRLDSQQEPDIEAIPTVLPVRVPDSDTGHGYAVGLELAARGADEGEITARSGLSAPEARILVAMQGMRRGRELN